MVARAMPNFALDLDDIVDAEFPPLPDYRKKFNLDALKDDSPIRTLPDGVRFVLVSASVVSRGRRTVFRLYMQKVTAQPHYRVYIEE